MSADKVRQLDNSAIEPDDGGDDGGPGEFDILVLRCKMEAALGALEQMKDVMPDAVKAGTHKEIADKLAEFSNVLVAGFFGE